MKTNVFLKSVMRQPARAMLLALLMVVASFALVVRIVEFVIVHDELQRIEELYSSVGVLAPIFPQNFSEDFDVRAAAEIVAQNPYVYREDRRVFVQGVMEDITNITAQIASPSHMMAAFEELDIYIQEHYFYAEIRFTNSSPRLISTGEQHFINIVVDVAERIVGDPTIVRDSTDAIWNLAGTSFVTLTNRIDLRLAVTHEESQLFAEGLWNPLEGLGPRTPILMHVLPVPGPDGILRHWLRPLVGEDGMFGEHNLFPRIDAENRSDNLVFFQSATNREALEALLETVQPRIDLAADNMHSMMVIGTQDMTALPRVQNPLEARLADTPIIQGGRWLTYEDYLEQNPVAVVPFQMATRQNLRVGETFTITLRSTYQPDWLDWENESRFSSQIEGWWAAAPQGWWATAQPDGFYEREYITLELTVVGVYHNTPRGQSHNFLSTEMYIPLSLIPEGFGWQDAPHLASMYSFVLNSPRDERAFLQSIEIPLLQEGFVARFMENGFAAFTNAADPIYMSLMVNLIVFSILSALILSLVVFLYLREWRKSVAITRALGCPKGKTMRQMVLPVVLLWLPAIVIGAVIGWFFALSHAEGALEGLSQTIGLTGGLHYVEETIVEMPRISWLMLLAITAGLLAFGDLFTAIAKWRKNIIISRANAISAGENPRLLLSQVFPIWTPLVLAFAAVVWVIALNDMDFTFGELFSAIAAGATNLSLDVTWLILMASGMAAATFGALGFFGGLIIRRPVLEQLQGAVVKTKKRKSVIAAHSNEAAVKFDAISADFAFAPAKKSKKNAKKSAFMHIWLHIKRMPVKTGLVVAIALTFTMSLGYLHHTILVTEAEIEYLWENTEITAELVRNHDVENILLGDMEFFSNAPISRTTLERFSSSPYVQGVAYAEALWRYGFLRSQEFFAQDEPYFGGATWRDGTDIILAVSDLDALKQENIRTPLDDILGIFGNELQITFAHGFYAEDFVFEQWQYVPVIVRPGFLAQHGYALGDVLTFDHPQIAVQIIGTFEGGLSRSVNRFGEGRGLVIMPLEALKHHTLINIFVSRPDAVFNRVASYSAARFILNPLYIENFRQSTEHFLALNAVWPAGNIELELIINDSILHNTIFPMEQNLALLQILYPIAIVVAAVLATGFAFLVMMQNAKNAAIMRVLGKTKPLTQIMLSGEQILLCIVGVILGMSALSAFGADITNAAPIILAAMYFICATLGSIIGAMVVSAKTPLELLQTRE